MDKIELLCRCRCGKKIVVSIHYYEEYWESTGNMLEIECPECSLRSEAALLGIEEWLKIKSSLKNVSKERYIFGENKRAGMYAREVVGVDCVQGENFIISWSYHPTPTGGVTAGRLSVYVTQEVYLPKLVEVLKDLKRRHII